MNDGGYVFPRPLPKGEWSPDEACAIVISHSGITLRDYFAGKALTGYVSNIRYKESLIDAQWCYRCADAMLAERAKGKL